MSRLIYADRLQRRIEGELSSLEETLETSKNEQERFHLLVMISDRCGFIKEINKADTVDAVEVVRCKYCRWGKEACGIIECNVDLNAPPEYHGYNWFCPNGEKRDEE